MNNQEYFYVPTKTDFEKLYGVISLGKEANKNGICFCACSVCSCACSACGICSCPGRCKCENGLPLIVRPSI